MKKIILTILAVAIAVSAATLPEFSAEDLDGETWDIDSLLGDKLTIISFWSTSCGPCKEELALMDSLYSVYADSGLQVIAVNVDSRRTLARVSPMVQVLGWSFTVLLDPEAEIMGRFRVGPIPHSFYVSPDGEIFKAVIGYTKKDAEEVIETIHKALHGDYSS